MGLVRPQVANRERNPMRSICTSIVATLMLAGAVHSQPVQWTVAEGGNGHWYAVIDGSDETWFDHRDRAMAMGGDLACVANESENEFIHDVQIGSGHCGGYVSLGGLQVQGKDEPAGGWYWVSGEPWSYTNWHPGGEPNDSGGGEWAIVFHSADGCLGKWNDVDPEELGSGHAMAIEWSADCNGDGIVDYGQILDGSLWDLDGNGVPDCCESGSCLGTQWRVEDGGNGHWYSYHGSVLNWQEHQQLAQYLGAHLATPTSVFENEYVHGLIPSNVIAAWIGNFQPDGSDEPDSDWQWVTGEAWSYINWSTGEPNNGADGEPDENHGAMYAGSGSWDDRADQNSAIYEWSDDCNGDGIVDYGQILDGTFVDLNNNGIPDICEPGACCHEEECYYLDLTECTLLGGIFSGENITCDQVFCGTTWVVAQDGSADFDSIQEAIFASDDGDGVIVMPGHYFENITFLGKAITVRSSVPTSPELTTIDGGGTFDNTVVFAAGEDGDSVLDGFFITGGNSPLDGGGIYCISNPTIRNCIISGNHADGNGGGVYITGNPTFDACTIQDNDADVLGDGIYISSEAANIIDCTFGASAVSGGEAVYAYGSGANFTGTTIDGQGVSGIGARLDLCSTTWTNCNIRNCNNSGLIITNSIADQFLGCTFSNNAANYGGGIYCEGGVTGAPILAGCIFNNNTASQDGGGIYCTAGSSPAITGCTITSNSAAWGGGISCDSDSSPTISVCTISGNTAGDDGGGVFCSDSSSPTFTDCTISDNTAVWGGGIGSRSSSNPTISGCIISGNTAADIGGGIYCDESSPTLTDCTFTGNTAIDGGGMQSINSMLTLTGCTFINNTVTSEGGGMFAKGSNSDSTLTGCTFENNTANTGGGMCNYMNSNITLTNCNFMNNTAAQGGGGMSNKNGSSPTLTDCTFESNASTGYYGGGMFNNSSSPTLTNCAFTGNSAAGDAGGMYNYSGSNAILTSCDFTDNIAEYAGGMRINDSSPTLIDCTFTGNTASVDGGGVWCGSNSSPVFTECVFESNSATSHGGGLFVLDSTPVLTNCPIINNTAGGDGGGIHNSDGGSPVLENCEFTGNQGVLGGGMYNGNDSNQEVANLTFTENTATRGGGIYVADTNVNSMIDSCTFVGNIATSDGGGLFSTATSCEVADSTFESNAAAYGAGLYLEEGSILRSELRGNIASVAGGGLYSASPTGIYLQDSLICENEPDWIEGEWIDGTGNDFPVNCPTDCPGDYDSDGDVNVVDILGVIGDWGPCNPDAPCPSDFNGDGVVGVNDVLIVISAWGPCE
jgi:parallel beta-helix repeat protein/predicted outer membrane repeat protein